MAERGSNCMIAVAGHATSVTNSAIAGVIDEAGQGASINEIYGAAAGVAGLAEGKIVDMGAQKHRTIEGLRRTPGSVLAGRHRLLTDAEAPALIEALRSREVGTLLLLGGSTAIGILKYFIHAAEQAKYPLVALGIPLSAENDVPAGDHTPGYGSAARCAASAARDAGRAAAAGEEPVLVLELLGQETGWLAAAAAGARDAHNPAPHAILVPERPVDLDSLIDELRRAYQKFGYAVAVTTEGATAASGEKLHGQALSALLRERLGLAVRYDCPGSLCRVAQSTVARADADEAYHLGSLAVRLADDECSGYVLTLQRDGFTADRDKGYKAVEGTAHVDQMDGKPRQLPAEYLSESGTQVTETFLDWIRPLLGGALPDYVTVD